MNSLYPFKTFCQTVFFVLPFLSFHVHAQEAEDSAQQQSEQIFQWQQQQQEAEQKAIEQQREHISIDPGVFESGSGIPDSAQCFNISDIELLGVTVHASKTQEKLIEAYTDQCLNLNKINQLLQSVTRLYFDKGYVTTRAYLPQQNLASGQLIIQVLEGQVEGLDKSQSPGVTLFSAFPGIQNKPLNLRDIEQGIEQLNRLGQNNVRMELVPGTEAGSSVIHLSNEKSRRWQTNIRFDNSGQPSTGEYLARGYFSIDNPLFLNDFAYLSYQMDTSGERGKDSRNLSLHWDAPYGYWLLSTDVTWFEYKSNVDGAVESFETSGDSQTQSVKLSRILTRSQTQKLEAISTLTRKENNNFIEDVKLDTSSRTLTVAELKLRHQAFFAGGKSLQSSLAYKRGLPWLGAVERQSSQAPNPEYSAFLADVNFSGNAQWFDQRWQYSSQLSMQYSDDTLFGSEQFSIGSLYSVRGFKGESVAANSGLFSHNDVSIAFPLPSNPLQVRSVTPTVGFDVGAVFDETEYQDLLSGAALGIALGGRFFSADVTYARALLRPGSFSDAANQIHFSLTLKL